MAEPTKLQTTQLSPQILPPIETHTPAEPAATNPNVPTMSAAVEHLAQAGLPRFGRFRVERFHARGGVGEVFIAEDEELRRPVAFKQLRPQFADKDDVRRRFILEAEITSKLEHPGIVPIYGLVQGPDGQPYYAMRFIDGVSLKVAIEEYHAKCAAGSSEQRLAFRTLLQSFITVCKTMAYAHSRSVLHRDLKPGNVMLGKFGETLVVDWGMAKRLDRNGEASVATGTPDLDLAAVMPDKDVTRLGQAKGTPAYMAPEQADGRWDVVGPCSDIYSLGAMLYTLLTSTAPVQGQDPFEVMEKAQRGDFPPPRNVKADVPKPLEAICLKAMALKPDDRYASATALADDVEHWLADEPVSAFVEPCMLRLRRWGRRHRALVASGVATLAMLAASLAVGIVLLDQANGALQEANQRERTEHQLALASANHAKAAQRRAEANLTLARQAVDNTVTKVAENPQLKQGNFHELRRELLALAVPMYEEFVRQQSDEPALEAERGNAYHRLAEVRRAMGEHEAARADHEHERDLFAKLARDFPAQPRYHRQLAGTHVNLGNLLADLGQLPAAEQEYRRAIAIQEKLVADFSAEPTYREGLALSHNNLGRLLDKMGQRSAEQFLRRGLAINEQLAVDFPSVPEYRSALAQSHSYLGILQTHLGHRAAAEREYRQSLEIQEKLAEEFPTESNYREGLAASHNNLGNLLQELGRQPAAEQEYRGAMDLYAQLAARFPAVPQYRVELARNHHNLGMVLRKLGQRSAAEQSYRQALAIREKLATDFPSVPEYRQELAACHDLLGLLLADLGQAQVAEKECRRAVNLQEQLVADFPTVVQYRGDLAGACVNLGNLLRDHGQEEDSLNSFSKAIVLLEPLVDQEPHLVREGLFLRNAHIGRALALDKLGRPADALRDWDRALILNPRAYFQAALRTQRAWSLARAGEHVKAVAEANALAELKDLKGDDFYHLACLVSVAAAAVKDDAKLQDQYAARAVELLRQAVAKGYNDIEHLKNDDDLKALREREDFQKLVKELESKP